MERDPDKLRLLLAWKNTLSTRHTVAYFSSPAELTIRVVTALNQIIQAHETVTDNAVDKDNDSELSDVFSRVESALREVLDAGHASGVVVGAIRAALASFAAPKDRLALSVAILANGDTAETARKIARALETEGADSIIQPLDGGNDKPGHITTLLESAEAIIVLSSNTPPHEDWLQREVEAALWRFIILPDVGELLPVSVDGGAVPPLLRARRHVVINSKKPHGGIAEILGLLRKYSADRDSRGTRIVRAQALLRKPG